MESTELGIWPGLVDAVFAQCHCRLACVAGWAITAGTERLVRASRAKRIVVLPVFWRQTDRLGITGHRFAELFHRNGDDLVLSPRSHCRTAAIPVSALGKLCQCVELDLV